ncbi:hypothetical protein PT2222_230035 [Paraburkholderia tropica]
MSQAVRRLRAGLLARWRLSDFSRAKKSPNRSGRGNENTPCAPGNETPNHLNRQPGQDQRGRITQHYLLCACALIRRA